MTGPTPPTTPPTTPAPSSSVPWAERAADRSPSVQRRRSRSVQQTRTIIDAARRLIAQKGGQFTTQELVKEARVALQTFYRHFAGKDQLLIAVIGDLIAESAMRYEEQARDLPDPVARLRSHVTTMLRHVGRPGDELGGPRFVTAEHWRLHQLYPDEMAEVSRPIAELLLREIRAAEAAGALAPSDAEHDAWHVTRLVMATYHHYAFATTDESPDEIADRVWAFCLAALGGGRDGGGGRRRSDATEPSDPSHASDRRSG